jgi:hypothetical protein
MLTLHFMLSQVIVEHQLATLPHQVCRCFRRRLSEEMCCISQVIEAGGKLA